MFKKLLNLIYEALTKMIGYKSVTESLDISDSVISDKMSAAFDLWKSMYKDESPWLNDKQGVYSLGLAKLICDTAQQQILSELVTSIKEPGVNDEIEEDKNNQNIDTRAKYLNDIYQKRLIKKLPQTLEKALALGGMIIKPYINNNQIFLDFNFQGDFCPISFDDDGNITDIAFIDQFIAGNFIYTKIERQTFSVTERKIIIENKAYKAKYRTGEDTKEQELGQEIPLSEVSRWSTISQEPVPIENVDKPLYGYYRVATANNVDMDSPLGISLFSPAVKMIERTDRQFSRLDWEYNGGQLAIDVDPTALLFDEGYFGTEAKMDELKDRLYRKVDLGTADTYKEFAPNLRDQNYNNGLNAYLEKIEILIGLAKGSLSQVQSEARTATEVKVLKQRTYTTISHNQEALEDCIMDVVYAMNVLTDLYDLAPEGDYDTSLDWGDSVLTDTDTVLEQKLNLKREGIISKAEVRAWYTGESVETAQAEIDEMDKKEQELMINDLFTNTNKENTLESNENNKTPIEEEDNKED